MSVAVISLMANRRGRQMDHAVDQATKTPSLIDRLERFNAKERFWLLMNLMGCAPGRDGSPNPGFPFCMETLKTWAKSAGLDPPEEGSRIFGAMDYHLSWLHAALTGELPSKGWIDNCPATPGATTYAVESNQEDIDFIVAYELLANEKRRARQTCLLFIEAKGVTDFSDQQTSSKLKRLSLILENALVHDKKYAAELRIGLLFVSPPARTRNFGTDLMRPPSWQPMLIPNELWRVTRCTNEPDKAQWSLSVRSTGKHADRSSGKSGDAPEPAG
jgi:hypothetical protein